VRYNQKIEMVTETSTLLDFRTNGVSWDKNTPDLMI